MCSWRILSPQDKLGRSIVSDRCSNSCDFERETRDGSVSLNLRGGIVELGKDAITRMLDHY
jgi:hypothetical protein